MELANAELIFDTFGVPEFFATHAGKVEDAGNGCVRLYMCIRKGGALIPVFTVVIPRPALIVANATVREGTKNLLPQELALAH